MDALIFKDKYLHLLNEGHFYLNAPQINGTIQIKNFTQPTFPDTAKLVVEKSDDAHITTTREDGQSISAEYYQRDEVIPVFSESVSSIDLVPVDLKKRLWTPKKHIADKIHHPEAFYEFVHLIGKFAMIKQINAAGITPSPINRA